MWEYVFRLFQRIFEILLSVLISRFAHSNTFTVSFSYTRRKNINEIFTLNLQTIKIIVRFIIVVKSRTTIYLMK